MSDSLGRLGEGRGRELRKKAEVGGRGGGGDVRKQATPAFFGWPPNL